MQVKFVTLGLAVGALLAVVNATTDEELNKIVNGLRNENFDETYDRPLTVNLSPNERRSLVSQKIATAFRRRSLARRDGEIEPPVFDEISVGPVLKRGLSHSRKAANAIRRRSEEPEEEKEGEDEIEEDNEGDAKEESTEEDSEKAADEQNEE